MSQSFVVPKQRSVVIGDGGNLDAFSRLRTADPTTLFDSQHQYTKQPLLWDESLAGTGASTHLPNEASVRLSTGGTASGAAAVRRTKGYIRYQPGKSQLIAMTFVLGAAATNVRKRVGYFDDKNGVFLEQSGGIHSIVRRTYTSGTATDNAVAQSSWNIDKFDGTGPSGKTLDFSKSQILIIDMQWLGVGRVRCGFDVDGILYYAHEFRNANSLTLVYMTSANLPLTYSIENTGTASGATTMDCICCMVASEGGFTDERGLKFSASNGTTTISVSTRRPILSARMASTLNSIQYNGQVIFENIDVYSSGMFVEVVLNGTLTGASWAAVDATYSGMERDVSATAISGGIVIDSFYVSSSGGAGRNNSSVGVLGKIPFAKSIGGTSDIVSIVCTSMGGATTTAASMSWREVY